MKNSSRLTFVALALALLLIPNFGMAQTSRTTGALIGIVTDGQGNPLPGVAVTVTSPQLQGARTAATDTKGEYNLPTLPPGTYRAQYELNDCAELCRQVCAPSIIEDVPSGRCHARPRRVTGADGKPCARGRRRYAAAEPASGICLPACQ